MPDNNAFFSIWTQDSPYWLVIEGPNAATLEGFHAIHHEANLSACRVGADWTRHWPEVMTSISQQAPHALGYRAAVLAADELPSYPDIEVALRPCADIQTVVNNLWLIQDIQKGRLSCYMQPVVDRRGKRVGYEAFARMEAADGGIIGGGAIMQAATALQVEYQVDRLLHIQAIETFVEWDLEGSIFINFLTGFIQRPEVYLEGLNQAAQRSHIRPGAVVLDVPLKDHARDRLKLKSIASYCRDRGFVLALDDVTRADGLEALLQEIRPAFVKLALHFGADMAELKRQSALREIVRMTHAIGANVLAEGVENQAMHDQYFEAGVDMFQGYLIAAPERYAPKKAQVNA